MPNVNLNISKQIFNDAYFPYLTEYSTGTEVYYGGAGSGKSVFITQKLIIKALKYKRRVLVIRKVGNSLRDSCWKLFIETLTNWSIYRFCKVHQSVMEIELPNGSVFLFKGLDDSEKIKSIVGVTDLFCEEATELTQEDYDQLCLRVRADEPYLQKFVSFNPTSKASYVYNRWFNDDTKDLTDTVILKTTYRDNKFLPPEYINSLERMKSLNPTFYNIYALGEFCSLSKLVYNNWSVKDFDYKDINGELCIGLDWGFVNDPTALIASIVDEDTKTIYVFDEAYQKGLTNDKIAKLIESHGFMKSVIIYDCAEEKSGEELRRLGVYRAKACTKGKDSINMGIQYINQFNIVVHPSLAHTIEELGNYAYKKDKDTNEYTNEPIDSYNHLLDALRYSMQILWKPNKLRVSGVRL